MNNQIRITETFERQNWTVFLELIPKIWLLILSQLGVAVSEGVNCLLWQKIKWTFIVEIMFRCRTMIPEQLLFEILQQASLVVHPK